MASWCMENGTVEDMAEAMCGNEDYKDIMLDNVATNQAIFFEYVKKVKEPDKKHWNFSSVEN